MNQETRKPLGAITNSLPRYEKGPPFLTIPKCPIKKPLRQPPLKSFHMMGEGDPIMEIIRRSQQSEAHDSISPGACRKRKYEKLDNSRTISAKTVLHMVDSTLVYSDMDLTEQSITTPIKPPLINESDLQDAKGRGIEDLLELTPNNKLYDKIARNSFKIKKI